MYDQLRPPTDNLYKFWALAGLAVAILAVYMNTTRDIKLATLHWQTDDARYTIEDLNDKYDGQAWNIDEDLRTRQIDPATAQTRKAEVAKRRAAAISKHQKEYSEARDASHNFRIETYYQYCALVWAGWIAAGFSLIAFYFWYVKLQKPLDEIMKLDLKERRLRADKLEKAEQ
ncbi:MAG TPA: hypothetical protein VGP76_30480 [Planctomycetaceae bacterium]|jgi:hypothetical protein|nr:hypothetical protein [Planctomycetaceae bacterium]